jgi:hypothetical protein
MQARNPAEVVDQLDAIIAWCREQPSVLGFFPSLYRQVTLRVQQRIAEGAFDDSERMDRLTTTFANRYLDAWRALRAGERTTRSWRATFRAADDDGLLILQHLLLGMNAHINLDLGVAAAEVAPGAELASLEGDFMRINEILGELLDVVQAVVGEHSPLLDLLDQVGGRTEEVLINFSMSRARDEAWEHAQVLAWQHADQRARTIDVLDHKVAFLATLIANPGFVLNRSIDAIRFAESRDVPAIIAALDAAGRRLDESPPSRSTGLHDLAGSLTEAPARWLGRLIP